MSRSPQQFMCCLFVIGVWSIMGLAALPAPADEPTLAEPLLPELRFFYYDSDKVEWIVSSETEDYQAHLSDDEQSATLVASLYDAVIGGNQPQDVRVQMTAWLAQQRQAFDRRSVSSTVFRKSEGIVAYLRHHDFDVSKLVKAIQRRSGASNVQLVAIHRKKGEGDSKFSLKVILENPKLDIRRKGYNVDLSSEEVGYVTVVYSLGLALYEVQELLSEESPVEELPQPPLELSDAQASAHDKRFRLRVPRRQPPLQSLLRCPVSIDAFDV